MSIPDDQPRPQPQDHCRVRRRVSSSRATDHPCHDKVPVIPWKEFQDTLMPQGVFDGLYRPAVAVYRQAGHGHRTSDGGVPLAASSALDLDTNKPGQKAENWFRHTGGPQLRLRSGNVGAVHRRRRAGICSFNVQRAGRRERHH